MAAIHAPHAPLSPGAMAPVILGPTPTTQTRRSRFSTELQDLAQQFADRPARLAELLAATQDRGFDVLLLPIALPFLTPIPLPDLSTPFGFVVLVIGARLALGRRPWLPATLLQRELPARFIARVLAAASPAVRWLEVLLRPRLDFLHEQWIYRRIAGSCQGGGHFQLYRWAGPGANPEPLPVDHLNHYHPEALVIYPQYGLQQIQVLSDDGTSLIGGCPCKELPDPNQRRFRSFWLAH
jgi:hypothetical protein